ncbi:Small subunit (SSU) processome component [Ascosphaera pollenicola]|nr:Small subunit (SSU) processome component [Ascosphaera pollenicola]
MSSTPTHQRSRKGDLDDIYETPTTKPYLETKNRLSSREEVGRDSPKYPKRPSSNYNAHGRAKSTSALKDKPRRRRHEAYDKRSRSAHPANVSRDIDRPVWRLTSYGTEDPNLTSFYTDSRRLFEEHDAWVSGRRANHGNDTDTQTDLSHRQLCQHSPTKETAHPEVAPERSNVEVGNHNNDENSDGYDDNKAEAIHIHDALRPTVMHWTSPTTRRREYAKIDRSTHGIRGFWRRFAPACCQASNAPLPFYDGQQTKKKGRRGSEGSVRRFRMDIADEDEEVIDESAQANDEKGLSHSFLSKLTRAESTLSSSWRKFNKHHVMKKKVEMKGPATACF